MWPFTWVMQVAIFGIWVVNNASFILLSIVGNKRLYNWLTESSNITNILMSQGDPKHIVDELFCML